MQRTRAIAAAVAVVLSSTVLTGCAPVTISCPSWADFSDPADAFRQATTILVGHVAGRDGTIATEFGDARAYSFDVEAVPKGTASGSAIRIGSRPDSCDGGDGYVSGDLLETNRRILVYLDQARGGLVTLTPGSGVVGFPEGSDLPFAH